VCVLVALFVFDTARSALSTLSTLDAVEAERDQWQRPSDVIHALGLKPGNVVVDVGCGSGYFTLKLSSSVGDRGAVMAEDIRALPLAFLWLRAVLRREHNVTIIHGVPDDPRLPKRADAILIANTYHEFTNPQSILAHVYGSLTPVGQFVVLDRAPNRNTADVGGAHEVSVDRVESDLRRAHFEIVSRQDRFIESDPDHEIWWMIVAHRI
jgi:predicted methyltransferase